MYGAVPPAELTVADPSDDPLHKASIDETVDVSTVGSRTVTLWVSVQPLASVTITV